MNNPYAQAALAFIPTFLVALASVKVSQHAISSIAKNFKGNQISQMIEEAEDEAIVLSKKINEVKRSTGLRRRRRSQAPGGSRPLIALPGGGIYDDLRKIEPTPRATVEDEGPGGNPFDISGPGESGIEEILDDEPTPRRSPRVTVKDEPLDIEGQPLQPPRGSTTPLSPMGRRGPLLIDNRESRKRTRPDSTDISVKRSRPGTAVDRFAQAAQEPEFWKV